MDIAPFVASLDAESAVRCHFLEKRVHVNWAGYSQVQAIRRLSRYAINWLAAPEDYLVMLSGQDYPIRPVGDLIKLLEAHPNQQYIRYIRVDDGGRKYTDQVDRLHHRDLTFLQDRTLSSTTKKVRNLLIRLYDFSTNLACHPPMRPNGIEIAHGPTLFALTAQCVGDLEASVTSELESFFATTFCPEEKFYHTLVANSPYQHRTPAGGFETFTGPGNYRYANIHLIDATLTRVFLSHDFDEISASGKYFLRKVSLPQSETLLNQIDQVLLGYNHIVTHISTTP